MQNTEELQFNRIKRKKKKINKRTEFVKIPFTLDTQDENECFTERMAGAGGLNDGVSE